MTTIVTSLRETLIIREAVKLQVLAPRPLPTSKMATLKVPDSRNEVKFPRLGLTQIVKSPWVACTPLLQGETSKSIYGSYDTLLTLLYAAITN